MVGEPGPEGCLPPCLVPSDKEPSQVSSSIVLGQAVFHQRSPVRVNHCCVAFHHSDEPSPELSQGGRSEHLGLHRRPGSVELEQFRAPVCQNHVGSGETGADREPGEVLSFSRLIARLAGDSLGQQEGHLVPQSPHPGEDCLPSPNLIPSPKERETAAGSAVLSDSLCCSGKPPGLPLMHHSANLALFNHAVDRDQKVKVHPLLLASLKPWLRVQDLLKPEKFFTSQSSVQCWTDASLGGWGEECENQDAEFDSYSSEDTESDADMYVEDFEGF